MSFNIGKTGLAQARVWHLVDAKDKILGKLAQRISIALRGKYKPTYHPASDVGDYVVVVNARHVGLTGKKSQQKLYRWHSGYPGGLKEVTFKDYVQTHPTAPLEKAVYGMLPKNNLRKVWMSRLKIFPDEEHPYKENILKMYDQPTASSTETETSATAEATTSSSTTTKS
ncbi:54S ribosomal protein L23, mitochondrial [Quaeritorhiza haematococci]|nr:54S ribosomal protein L23, mitochondrial [Quaeritorhiza haematococci]